MEENVVEKDAYLGIDELWIAVFICPKCKYTRVLIHSKYCPECGIKLIWKI